MITHNKRKILLTGLAFIMSATAIQARRKEVTIRPCTGEKLQQQIAKNLSKMTAEDTLTVLLTNAPYRFNPDKSPQKELYISNHDQDNPKTVGIVIENASNVTIEGNGAELLYDGHMLPIVVRNSDNIVVRNLSVDFTNPHISQIVIESNDVENGVITYRPEPWVNYEIIEGNFTAKGNGWSHVPRAGIAFEEGSRHVVYRTGDIAVGTTHVSRTADGSIIAPWKDSRLVPGTRVALRSYARPTPGIFVDKVSDITLENVKVHYAEGMGLLAQNSRNITLDGFGVCLRGDNDPRYFTTQADATHFSGCSGRIISRNGLYEGMMDDAINVHGTYLKITSVVDPLTVKARYMHGQTYGFEWGAPGDSVQAIAPRTMEPVETIAKISSIEQIDLKEFLIAFDRPIDAQPGYGIENLTRSPEVEFSGNTVRNNRARGALFSTPRRTLCSNNLFDHTSGTAILLCGDCNGWFETGACHDVTITGNRFINALTSLYQFTNAVISIYPEIPDLEGQQKYFHSGINITENHFETFDNPLLYAKSVNGLIFMNNTINHTRDYAPFHPSKAPITLEKVTNVKLQ